jgi:hypothetical protein
VFTLIRIAFRVRGQTANQRTGWRPAAITRCQILRLTPPADPQCCPTFSRRTFGLSAAATALMVFTAWLAVNGAAVAIVLWQAWLSREVVGPRRPMRES